MEDVHEYINFSQGKRELNFVFSCQFQHQDWVCALIISLLKGTSFDAEGMKSLYKLLSDGRACGEDVSWVI